VVVIIIVLVIIASYGNNNNKSCCHTHKQTCSCHAWRVAPLEQPSSYYPVTVQSASKQAQRKQKKEEDKTVIPVVPVIPANVKETVANSYIVELRPVSAALKQADGLSAQSVDDDDNDAKHVLPLEKAEDVAKRMLSGFRSVSALSSGAAGSPASPTLTPELTHAYDHAFYGYAVDNVSPATLAALRSHEQVLAIHENGVAHMSLLPGEVPRVVPIHHEDDGHHRDGNDADPILSAAAAQPTVQATKVLPWGVIRMGVPSSSLKLSAGKTPTPVNAEVWHLDTGADLANPDLNITFSKSFVGTKTAQDLNGHGTHTAGTVAGRGLLTANNTMLVGTAPGAQLRVLQVLNANGSGTFAQIIAAVDFVTAYAKTKPQQRHIVTMSLGAEVGTTALNALDLAVAKSISSGVLYCIAAGNSSSDASRSSPAHTPGVLAVGAMDSLGRFAGYSNRGSKVGIEAPGTGIISVWINNSAAIISGTSMATPHVAGCAILARKKFPSLSVAALRQKVIDVSAPSTANPAVKNLPSNTTNRLCWEAVF